MARTNCRIVYVTCPKGDAKRVARVLLDEKLVACCNILPAESIYWWAGRLESGKEEVLVAKTLPAKEEKVINRVSEIHKYEVPCILVVDGRINESYSRHLKSVLGE